MLVDIETNYYDDTGYHVTIVKSINCGMKMNRDDDVEL